MKTLLFLLATLALIAPPSAQDDVLRSIEAKHGGKTVMPASKTILVYTGKPITKRDKARIGASVLKSYLKMKPRNKPGTRNQPQNNTPPPPTTFTVTPAQMYQDGFVQAIAQNPTLVDLMDSKFTFIPGIASNLCFCLFPTQADTTYVLVFKVETPTAGSQFTVLPAMPNHGLVVGTDTFSGAVGDNEFAYAFVANRAGVLYVSLFSPNAYWSFDSCEITATPAG